MADAGMVKNVEVKGVGDGGQDSNRKILWKILSFLQFFGIDLCVMLFIVLSLWVKCYLILKEYCQA